MKIPMLSFDKANHFVYGDLAGLFGSYLAVAFGRPDMTRQAAVLAAAVAGFVKEAFDWWSNRKMRAAGLRPVHGVEWGDFFATMAGGVTVALRP